MRAYEDDLTLREARDRYFESSGIGREYDVAWVELMAGPVPIRFPNTRGRVRAAKLHDLHHVATGYPTTWTGEAEIGAWEIASGCGRFAWAWALNFGGVAAGFWIAPRAMYRAFLRGRRSRNLYRLEGEFRETLLDETVGSLRDRLAIPRTVPVPTVSDRVLFLLCLAVAGLWAAPFVLVAIVIARLAGLT